ncbi:hypothetical protein [Rossellomorea sp. DA94]|uniref:hypothetical protein n=1 Tax=Rossellomorea sp. DA94 TaxID=3038653 RepID=UPI0024471C4F|nr:hypothetical protein [Rossellomorea sp. DA94]WGG44204.1 hypothetical protein P8596_15620 [Rossellomorea sp. DA94]
MLLEVVEYILTMKRRKNFEILDKKTAIFFLISTILSIINFLLTIFIDSSFILIPLIVSIILFLISLKRLDKKIIKARRLESKTENKQLRNWIEQNYYYNHSSQFKELSILLEKISQNYKWKFNMNSLLVMFIPIWSGISITMIKEDPSSLKTIFILAALITLIVLFVGFWTKTVLEEIFDTKHNKIAQAARFMAETSIELSVKENKKVRSRLNGRRIQRNKRI